MTATRRRAGTGLLLASALLIGVSGFLPPGHPQAHYAKLAAYAAMLGDSVAAGVWDVTPFLLGLTAACALPAVAGAALLAGAIVGRGRLAVRVSFLLDGFFLGGGAAVLWLFFVLNVVEAGSDPRLRLGFGGGAALLTLLLALEVLLFRRAAGRREGRPDGLHVVPLVLLAAGGLAAGVVMWESEQWHAGDYLAVAAAAGLGLAGVALRWR